MLAAIESAFGLFGSPLNRTSRSSRTCAANVMQTFPLAFVDFLPVMFEEYFMARPVCGLHKPEKGFRVTNMETSLYNFVLTKLESAKGHWQSVADGSGVPRRTLEKIARRETQNPGIKHVEALAEYFRKSA